MRPWVTTPDERTFSPASFTMAKGQTGKVSKRNVNINVACGDRKMVFLLGLTAIMFTLSMVFIAKALYPREFPMSMPGTDCTIYNQELDQCSRKQTVASVALKKTINDLVTCKAGAFFAKRLAWPIDMIARTIWNPTPPRPLHTPTHA